jgi:hypothetical protein
MTFEILYENYQITIYYCKNEEENEEEKNNEGNTTNGNDSIKINILDMDTMYKYETKINSYEDLDKLPEFMQNLEVISNMICSALEKKSNSVKCSLIKEDDKIILDMIYQAEFFKIPFKIPVLIEPESDNIVFERKLRELQIKNQKLEKELNLLKKIPISIKKLFLYDKDINYYSREILESGGRENWYFLKSIESNGKTVLSFSLLKNLKNLKKLTIYLNRYSKSPYDITEWEGLSNLENLEEFTLFGSCYLKDITAFCDSIGNLKNLKKFELFHEYDKLAAKTIIVNLKKLEKLESVLFGEILGDLSSIICLKNLKILKIRDCDTFDFRLISNFKNLRLLDIRGDNHNIEDITPITSLKYLRKIILQISQLCDLQSITSLKNLEYLGLTLNTTKELNHKKNLLWPITNLPNLRTLELDSMSSSSPKFNHIDLTILKDIRNLKQIILPFYFIIDINDNTGSFSELFRERTDLKFFFRNWFGDAFSLISELDFDHLEEENE